MKKSTDKKINMRKYTLIAVAAVAVIVIIFGSNFTGKAKKEASQSTAQISVTKDSDLVIPVKDITETPSFYPAEMDGTSLEVIAVKASDGTIRTAFNTCQVCYSSGRGYYKVEGDQLVCQNCGNRFNMDDVQVTKGGCNPVPITSENKTDDNNIITISKDYLTQATVIFQNWK